jgi:AcrR family transcriptional regulator
MSDDAAAGIMEATYRALCEHGYAELTMQRIADESDCSKAALHYHFDTKEELLRSFLDYLLERFEAEIAGADAADPRERLDAFLEVIFESDNSEGTAFAIALLEIKAQAPYDEAYRDRLLEWDRAMRAVVAGAVRDGVERGTFREVDPDSVARFVATTINGAHVRQVALDEDMAATRDLLEAYLDRTLVPAGSDPEGPSEPPV